MVEYTRRTALKVGGAGTLIALLAGCSPSPSNGGGAAAASLRVWMMNNSVSEPARDWLKKTFEEQHPGSTLTIEIQQWDGIVSKLQTSLASAGSTPDIIEFGNTQAPTFASVGALLSLDDMKKNLGGDSLTKSLVELGSYGGAMYAAPFYAGSRLFYYRKDMFEAAGVTVPTTIDELTAAATTLQKANPTGNANFSGLYLPGISWQEALAWQFTNGSRLATEDGGTWKGALSTPKSQKALSRLQEMWQTGSTSGGITDGVIAEQPWLPFNSGETAMFFGFNWHLHKIDPALISSGKVGFFGFPPAEAGGVGRPFAGGSNIAISAKSKNQDLAKKALSLIFSKPFQEYFATEGGWVPGNLDYAAALGDDELAKLTTDAVRNSVGTPAAKNWALVESARVIDDFYVAVAAGGDVKALAAAADKRLTSLLNQG